MVFFSKCFKTCLDPSHAKLKLTCYRSDGVGRLVFKCALLTYEIHLQCNKVKFGLIRVHGTV